MKSKIMLTLTSLALLTGSGAFAQETGTADANVEAITANATATYNAVKTPAFAIAGALILWGVGKRVFLRLVK